MDLDGGATEDRFVHQPKTQNSGSQRGLGARIRSGQGRDRAADTTIFGCAKRFESGEYGLFGGLGRVGEPVVWS